MRFDFSVARLITDAYKTETDIYLRMPFDFTKKIKGDGIKTLILLPGAFFGNDTPFFSYGEKVNYAACSAAPDILFADIRFMNDASFREFITKKNYRRIVPVFSECALIGEYCYKEAYSWIGEYRAEISHFCQVVPLFSSCVEDIESFQSVFASSECIVIGERTGASVKVYKANSPSAKFYHTAAEAEKYAYRRITVYFNSRSELKDFGKFLDKRGTAYIAVDGSLSAEDYFFRIKKYREGKINILLATKSFIPTSLFYPPEIVFLCSVPFSLTHLERLTPASSFSPLKIIYCEDDYKRNDRIVRSFADALENENVYKKGAMHLSVIKNFLDSY